MNQRTVPEINQHSLTLPPDQTRTFSIQIELPVSDCQSLGLDSLHIPSQSDNLDSTEVGVKREHQSYPTSPSGSPRLGRHSGKHWKSDPSPTGRYILDSKFQSVETQTSSNVRSLLTFWSTSKPMIQPSTSFVGNLIPNTCASSSLSKTSRWDVLDALRSFVKETGRGGRGGDRGVRGGRSGSPDPPPFTVAIKGTTSWNNQ